MTSTMPGTAYKPIAGYGVIGNCQSAALVGLDGSIDWACFPRFDSPSVFAGVLDGEKGGKFAITPTEMYTSTARYVGDTNVLETRFETPTATVVLTDLMPYYTRDDGSYSERNEIVRVIRGERGEMEIGVEYSPRPDYGRAIIPLVLQNGGFLCERDGRALTMKSDATLELEGAQATGQFTIRAGDELTFVVAYSESGTPTLDDGYSVEQQIAGTLALWEEKAAEVQYTGLWKKEVTRSYLALHLLTYAPTGAIVAALTSSLPEEIGGVRNWDYRYTWLRDAAFTIDALVLLGHKNEALDFFKWLGDVCTLYGDDIGIMYRVDRSSDLEEQELRHLEGYRASAPVRIGNGAATQRQHDVFGEVLASAHLMATSGQPISDMQWELLQTLARLAAQRWHEPDSGIWEVRGGPFHFVYSKVMSWVALDRAAKLARLTGRVDEETAHWEQTAAAIKAEVLEKGWNAKKQAFVQHYDTDAMDASNLLIPLMGFLPFTDPRVISTVERIREELGHGSYLLRYRTEETDDGLSGGEGAFTLCSFWLAQVLAGMGRKDEGRELLSEMIGHANHLGLFSEMVDPTTGEALGNAPQAFTHIGLILASRACFATT